MGALGLHIYHGAWSMFQTLGLNGEKVDGLYRALAVVASVAVVLGNVSIPVAVLAGVLR